MEYLIEWLPEILNGFILTAEFTIAGVMLGLLLGTILAIGDLYGGRAISALIRVYVEFFRGSPIVIQLFLFFFTVPSLLNIIPNSFVVGTLVFTMNSAAYQKGYIKGAMEAVFEDQMTAGLSIGMTKAQTIFYVILPQALRLVIPAWSNEFASLTKSTPALLFIAVNELTGVARGIVSLTFRSLETYGFVALIYLAWISAVAKIADILYERWKIPGVEISV
jgi:polar amino acid transport system permease protein